ncbi:hypothetical protein [Streptomyces sp. CoH27]|uniref:hypothetical protein n=1 Tax=Streptomyces sp. CoH27 TaxID=2875763 RepID=UPI001CD81A22|nr:hypothetical protein [Streptomyces sp. CoH27]
MKFAAAKPVATAFLALGLTTTLLGGVARADIPGVNGVYTGCYSRTNGVLRLIDFEAGQRCRPGETTVTWNQTGPQGPAGPQGRRDRPDPRARRVRPRRNSSPSCNATARLWRNGPAARHP